MWGLWGEAKVQKFSPNKIQQNREILQRLCQKMMKITQHIVKNTMLIGKVWFKPQDFWGSPKNQTRPEQHLVWGLVFVWQSFNSLISHSNHDSMNWSKFREPNEFVTSSHSLHPFLGHLQVLQQLTGRSRNPPWIITCGRYPSISIDIHPSIPQLGSIHILLIHVVQLALMSGFHGWDWKVCGRPVMRVQPKNIQKLTWNSMWKVVFGR